MRVAVVNTHVPFTRGGAEMHADGLVDALRNSGHEVELVQIPFCWNTPWSVMDHLMATRLLDLERVNGKTIDRVIGLRFPAYHVRHPNKYLWIIHQYRSAFDFWEDPAADLPKQEGGRAVRDAIRIAERRLLGEAKALFANSQNVSKRLSDYCGRQAEVLYHPPALLDLLKPGRAGSYFLCPGRIETLKRQDFILESLARCQQPVRIRFVGAVGSETFFKSLQKKAYQLGIEKQVDWCGFVSKEVLVDLYAEAQAVVYAPHDEDYGYVSLEAHSAHKPVITTEDAGGVLEFVDESNGWVSSRDPSAFACQLDQAWANKPDCIGRGQAGFERLQSLEITWSKVVEKLVV